MLIRDAIKPDLPQIVAIYNETIPGRLVTADLEPVTPESREAWFDAHNAETLPLWVVTDEEKIIAWASFQSFYGRPAYRHTAEISIYVSEKHRGQGLGAMLLGRSIENCKSLEIHNLLGFIFGHNEPSLNLFKRFGFETWANMPGIAVLDGIGRDLIIVGKKLTA
jgi:L-amino acid N-acyltransferase YncA